MNSSAAEELPNIQSLDFTIASVLRRSPYSIRLAIDFNKRLKFNRRIKLKDEVGIIGLAYL